MAIEHLNAPHSYLYIIAPSLPYQTILTDINHSDYGLIILGNMTPTASPIIHTSDYPLNNKIIIGYIDIAESTAIVTTNPRYLNIHSTQNLPSWFGKPNPGFRQSNPLYDLYTVQYWHPEWVNVIEKQITDQIAQGYDGIFLDVTTGYEEWAINNRAGNPVVSDALQKMDTLLNTILNFISNLNLSKPFYVIPNNISPALITIDPGLVSKFSALFVESSFWRQSPTNGAISIPTSHGQQSINVLVPLYATQTVLGNDYPPLSDPIQIIKTLEAYQLANWVPSVQQAFQDTNVLINGPFIIQATTDRPIITGETGVTNFMSGGLVSSVKMIGSPNSINYFLGGPSTNTIIGGSNDDTIYAHPVNASQKNSLHITYHAININSSQPYLSIYLDDKLYGNSPIAVHTSPDGSGESAIDINIANYSFQNTILFLGTGMTYYSRNQFSNIFINSVSINGAMVDLSKGNWSNNINVSGLLNNNDTALFRANSFQVSSAFPSNTSDTIDGGLGNNTVVYRSLGKNYSVVFSQDNTITVSTGVTAEGPDTLTNIQKIQFTDQTLDTSIFTKTAALQQSQIIDLVELYIASFNRAPDSIGLNYWGSRLSDGMPLQDIAESFFVQPETVVTYPTTMTTKDFVTKVYNNVLSRGPDDGGLNYWINELNTGHVSKDSFLLAIINGARASTGSPVDRQTLANKELVGAHYAIYQGLNNSTAWAKDVMSGVTDQLATVTAANAKTDQYAVIAATPATSDLVVKLVGVAVDLPDSTIA